MKTGMASSFLKSWNQEMKTENNLKPESHKDLTTHFESSVNYIVEMP